MRIEISIRAGRWLALIDDERSHISPIRQGFPPKKAGSAMRERDNFCFFGELRRLEGEKIGSLVRTHPPDIDRQTDDVIRG